MNGISYHYHRSGVITGEPESFSITIYMQPKIEERNGKAHSVNHN